MIEGDVGCWVALAAFQGMQIREIAGLNVQDVNLSGQVIEFREESQWPRSTILHPVVVGALQDLPMPSHGSVFPNANPKEMSKAISKHLRNCDIQGSANSLVRWHGQQVEAEGKHFGRFPEKDSILALTAIEREIVAVLDGKLPGVSQNYKQAIFDLSDPNRIAFA